MNLKVGNKNDHEVCIAIARELSKYFNESGINLLKKHLEEHMLFTIGNDEVFGFLMVMFKSNVIAEISWMAIKKEKQGQGIGSVLIELVSENLKEKGCKILEVKTLSPDCIYAPYEKTRKFYEKMGFIPLEKSVMCPEWEPENPSIIYIKIL